MLNHAACLLVELDIGEDGVDAPGLGEHGAEGEGEAGHEDPRLGGADVGEGGGGGDGGVQAKDYHTATAE